MKKTLLAIFLVMVMLVTLALPAAAESGKLSAVPKISEDGTSFTVDLVVKDNPGIIAMTAKVSYDSKVFKLKSAKNGEIFESIFMPSQTLAVNPYQIIWMDATASEDIKTNGVLATYTFEVLSNAAFGETQIKFEIAETVNFNKETTSSFDGCSLKVNVNGAANQTTSTLPNNTDSSDAGTADDQTLVVQKPLKDNTDSDTSSKENVTSTITENTSSDSSNDLSTDEQDDDVEGKDRTLITVITIAGVLLAGVAITIIAIYFRKKQTPRV